MNFGSRSSNAYLLQTRVLCTINDFNVGVILDSGADHSAISYNMTQLIEIDCFIDKRMRGKAVGIGNTNIFGQIFNTHVKIGNIHTPVDFLVLSPAETPPFILIGLDFLYSLGCVLDFKKRIVTIGDEVVDFLNEHEIEKYEIPVNRKKELIVSIYRIAVSDIPNRKETLDKFLGMIVNNIVSNQNNEKYRKINTRSKSFTKNCGCDTFSLMRAIGFVILSDGYTFKYTGTIEFLRDVKNLIGI